MSQQTLSEWAWRGFPDSTMLQVAPGYEHLIDLVLTLMRADLGLRRLVLR
jgi:hypothetical protein